ncbi:aspartyl/asparaginyl beta-hydroxylase domain-containing protein [Gimibacter soli]|uniref:Aspartyl/asparaginyl beta-hydroxylase domain-containing protein n=1 Tax=Gimibacter soli TaxID=3024400 RepID=A0AAE9XL01_9PROT|nr:aspartyl/asparaginyl beta-hydroxylase domain-containing protein [Gimibacter soli]WCL52857.1 aspartyl/asparaginyl beta-hydroxylase domain-containing protein [Gimibacter soli]
MNAPALYQELESHLRQGATGRALEVARQIAAAGGTAPWMAIAKTCHERGDQAGEEEALSRRLREQRGDIGAISGMAELKRAQGDRRAAENFYRLGLNTVAHIPNAPPPLRAWAERAQAYLQEGIAVYAAHLDDQMKAAGIDVAASSPRIREAFDLLTGRTPLYLQQPSMFFYPGLPHRAWYEREEFDWVPALEARTEAITAELKALLETEDGTFTPYVQAPPGRPAPNNPLLDDPSWGAAYLYKSGERQPLADHCPAAIEALSHTPQPSIESRSPMALFSRLKPGTHIKPHNGLLNTRLICHLPLIAPDRCGLRVGPETRTWQEGKLFIFDDSFEHEAWNRGTSDRTVMLFEIWRPEIPEDDRKVLTALFASIDRFDEDH